MCRCTPGAEGHWWRSHPVEASIVRKVEAHYIQVELAGQHTRGYTAVDRRAQMRREPNVNLVLEIDMERFWELMQAAVQ